MPVVPGAWKALAPGPAALLVRRLDELGFEPGDVEIDAVRVLKLSFYPGWLLCDLQIAASPDRPAREATLCLYGPDGCTPVDGNSARVHGHNQRHGVALATDAQRQDYLQFFCNAVFGEEGPFCIVHPSTRLVRTVEHGDPVDPAAIVPLGALPAEEQSGADYACTVVYARSLFSAKFELSPSGMVAMNDDQLILDMVAIDPELQFERSRRRIFTGRPD